MLELFKEFDKDKLFAIIDRKFATNPDTPANNVKAAFERIVSAGVVLTKMTRQDIEEGDKKYIRLITGIDSVPTDPARKKSMVISNTYEQSLSYNLSLSDILYFMNALFPQKDVNTGYSGSEFLQTSNENVLPFVGANSLDTKHDII
jgi:hypothetical protein